MGRMAFFSGKQLVVLGAGYIGGAVARDARALGLSVVALTRNPDKAAALRRDGIETVEADIADTGWHEAMPRDANFVLNAVSSGGGGIEGYRHSYVEGMKSVAAWVRRTQPSALVYTSSTSVYPQDGGVEVDESAPTTPAEARAALLLEAESAALAAAGDGTRVFVLRLAGIYGPGRHHLLDQIRAGEVLAGSGEHRLNLAHQEDIGAAVLACFAAPPEVHGGVFNVVDDHPVRKRELAEWVAARLGVTAPRFDPALPGRRRAVTPDRVVLNHKIKRVLGWRPRHPDYRAGYETLLSR